MKKLEWAVNAAIAASRTNPEASDKLCEKMEDYLREAQSILKGIQHLNMGVFEERINKLL